MASEDVEEILRVVTGLRADMMDMRSELTVRTYTDHRANVHVRRTAQTAMMEARTLLDIRRAMQRRVPGNAARMFGPECEAA